MKPNFPSALALIAGVFAAGLPTGEAIAPSAWAAKNLIVADGPRRGLAFDPALTPYLIEPLDFFSDAVPGNKGVFKKSKQIGATTLAIAAVGYSAAEEPSDLFLIEPTADNLSDFLALKLAPAIEGSPKLCDAILPQTSRSGKGSTTSIKRFRGGGSLLAGIATSTAFLRGKTRQKVIRDEASEYLADLGGQGSPHDMISGAYETFLAGGDWKDLWISTPTIKGSCHISKEFEAGDQRYWHVPCPGCGSEFVFKFDRKLFRFNDAYPYEAHYVAPCCGTPIEAHEKNDLVRKGRWVATAPAPGKHFSWHFDTLSSPFVPWDTIAERALAAAKDPAKAKTFDNLTLGIEHEVKGNAPDFEALLKRVEPDLKRGHVPPKGLILTAFADVQMRGIWLEIEAVAPNRETWCVDALYIDGDTASHNGAAFQQLKRETLDREFPDAYGRMRTLDAIAVDSGYRAHVVYSWVRQNQRVHPITGRDLVLATKGLDGWGRPAIGQPQLVDINLDGKKIRQGCKVWGIGTWPLKGNVYSDLFNEMPEPPAPPIAPAGYCHFGTWCDAVYFQQVTAEHLEPAPGRNAQSSQVWVAHGANHFLDCRVGNAALAEYLGLTSTTPDQWAALARARGLPEELTTVDLFTPRDLATTHDAGGAAAVIEQRKAEEKAAATPQPAPVPARAAWLSQSGGSWLRRH